MISELFLNLIDLNKADIKEGDLITMYNALNQIREKIDNPHQRHGFNMSEERRQRLRLERSSVVSKHRSALFGIRSYDPKVVLDYHIRWRAYCEYIQTEFNNYEEATSLLLLN